MAIVDGKKIADKMLENLKSDFGELLKSDFKNTNLAAVLVGDIGIPSNPSGQASKKFLEIKEKAARRIGIGFKIYEFPEDIDQKKLEEKISEIVKDKENSGVIAELPLPKHLDTQKILDVIPPEKDPDVLSSKAQYAFFIGDSLILPPAVEAVKQIFIEHKVDTNNKKAVVFGHGILVGKPIATWLMQQGSNVKIIDEFTDKDEANELTKKADVVISGVGKPNLITDDMVKDGVVIIDFGFNPSTSSPRPELGTKAGQVVGDITKEVSDKASLVTPVPGGVGPLVVASVLKNLVLLNS